MKSLSMQLAAAQAQYNSLLASQTSPQMAQLPVKQEYTMSPCSSIEMFELPPTSPVPTAGEHDFLSTVDQLAQL